MEGLEEEKRGRRKGGGGEEGRRGGGENKTIQSAGPNDKWAPMCKILSMKRATLSSGQLFAVARFPRHFVRTTLGLIRWAKIRWLVFYGQNS